MYFPKTLALLSAALTAVAASHQARGVNHHAIAARAAQPYAAPEPVPSKAIRKRADTNRCKVHATSSSVAPVKSVASDPTSESTKTPEPTPTKTTHKPTTTKTTHKPTTTTKSSGGGGNDPQRILSGTHTGEGTYYLTGLTACGIVNNDSEYIVALSKLLFDTYPGYNGANPNNNPLCKRMIRATYKGNSVDVMATDRCEGCAMWDLDFSPAAFKALDADGRVYGVEWYWL